jgi:3-oxoacyl-[acyl-carrier protein] reductase
MEFKDKVAIITGAAGGIGSVTALSFAKEGARVALFDIDEERLTGIRERVEKEGGEALIFALDIRNFDEVQRAVDDILDKWGRVDILVNNAGITRDNLLLRMTEEEWRDVIDINLTGAFNFTKAVIRPMMKARGGVIINISSVVGITGNPGQTNYSSSKAALIAFTKSLAKELGVRGIRVMAIAPGFIETPMTEKLSGEIREKYISQIPLRRAGKPEDVANLILFLASDKASYITGQVYIIDGGMT